MHGRYLPRHKMAAIPSNEHLNIYTRGKQNPERESMCSQNEKVHPPIHTELCLTRLSIFLLVLRAPKNLDACLSKAKLGQEPKVLPWPALAVERTHDICLFFHERAIALFISTADNTCKSTMCIAREQLVVTYRHILSACISSRLQSTEIMDGYSLSTSPEIYLYISSHYRQTSLSNARREIIDRHIDMGARARVRSSIKRHDD